MRDHLLRGRRFRPHRLLGIGLEGLADREARLARLEELLRHNARARRLQRLPPPAQEDRP